MLIKNRFALYFGGLALLGALGTGPVFGAGWKSLPGHVPRELSQLKASGRLAATHQMRLAIGVALRDPAGLDDFLAQLYDPASPNYRHYLTPEEFADRFGPTETDYEAVKNFARTNGLAIVGTHRNRLLLDVIGPAAAVEKAFHVTLRTYPHPTEARQFFATDTEPTVDTDLPVVDIEGLSDFSRPHPKLKKMDLAHLVPKDGSAPDGSGSYFGNDFRAAYVPGTTLTGAGQSVGLLEFEGFYAADIANYAAAAGNGRTNILVQTNLVDGFSGVPDATDPNGIGEVSLDIEMAMAIAPGLSKIVVFETGTNGWQNDLLNAMVTYSNSVKQLSCSWGWPGGPSNTTDNIFKNMAAAGQSFFNASGDSGAFTTGANSVNGVDNPSQLLAGAPSSCPYIIQVGGTTLTTTGTNYTSETVWNWNTEYPGQGYDGVASSGGISSYYSIPSWQTNVSNLAGRGGSASFRNIPDVSLTADSIYVVSSGSGAGGTGGTSCAAPLWAGFIALVNQQAAAYGRPSVGFINPAIYAIAASSSYTNCFHDVTTGNNIWSSSPSLFYAMTGFDLCTGLGTPTGTNLINALVGPSDTLGISPITGFAFSGPFGGPFNPGSGVFQLTNNGAAALNWSLVTTSAWLTVAFTNGTLAAHTATNPAVSLAASATSLAVGNYSTTLAFTNQATHVVQSLPVSLQVYQPLSVTPGTGFTAVGPVGGPLTPSSQIFTLTNLGSGTVNWNLVNTSAWLTASAAGGSLTAGGQTTVTVSLSASANSLPAAVYNANVLFTNQNGVAAVVPFAALVGQPIIQNGGFETGTFSSWTQAGNTGSTSVTSGSGNATYIHSGTYAAKLGPAGSPGYLSQNLTTPAGQNYLLSLWLRNPTGATPNQFQVQWSGVTIFAQTNITSTAWTNLQFLVTASSSLTPLQFSFQDDPQYLGLDDVSVTPLVPLAFSSTAKAANNFQLAWNANTGLVYQVQYKTNLLQANWISVGSAITAKTNALTLTDTNAFQFSAQRFYRLQLSP